MEKWLAINSGVSNNVFLATLGIILVWEIFFARRKDNEALAQRWKLNFILMFINMLVVYIVFPISAIAFAIMTQDAGWGVFNNTVLPFGIVFILSILVMDLWNYTQHYLMHRFKFLWKIHRVHHADTACDVTTSLRFHPLEVVFSLATDLMIILVFGIPAQAVIIYRLVRLVVSTVVHGNILIPEGIDRLLRYLLITPDMHRVHHSINMQEHNSNYSGGLIWWDYIFGTYVAQPAKGHQHMKLGLSGYEPLRAASLKSMLMEPFLKSKN